MGCMPRILWPLDAMRQGWSKWSNAVALIWKDSKTLPPVIWNSSLFEHGPVESAWGFPWNMVIFHSYVNVYQRVISHKPPLNHNFPVVFLRFSHDFPILPEGLLLVWWRAGPKSLDRQLFFKALMIWWSIRTKLWRFYQLTHSEIIGTVFFPKQFEI